MLTVILCIFLISRTMYANVLAGESLSMQYETILQNIQNVTLDNTTKEVSSRFEEIDELIVELKMGNQTKIETTTAEILKRTNKNIDDYRSEYKRMLDETVATLKQTNFDDYVNKEEIEEGIDQNVGNSLNDMLNGKE